MKDLFVFPWSKRLLYVGYYSGSVSADRDFFLKFQRRAVGFLVEPFIFRFVRRA